MSKKHSNQVYNPITLNLSNVEKFKTYFNTYKIIIESNDARMLKSAGAKLCSYIKNDSGSVISITTLPTNNVKVYSPIKSPHVNKKSREQLETAVYRNAYTFKTNLNNNTVLKAINLL